MFYTAKKECYAALTAAFIIATGFFFLSAAESVYDACDGGSCFQVLSAY